MNSTRQRIKLSLSKMIFLTLLLIGGYAQGITLVPYTIELSEPGKPVQIAAVIANGSIHVHSHNKKNLEVVIIDDDPQAEQKNKQAASKSGGFNTKNIKIEEVDNRVEIYSHGKEHPVKILLRVPKDSELNLRTQTGEGIFVKGIGGKLELISEKGVIQALDISGGIVADSKNGKVTISFVDLETTKISAITTVKGDVDITFPERIKAKLEVESIAGQLFTAESIELKPKIKVEHRQKENLKSVALSDALFGELNGGGKAQPVNIKSLSGDIYLRVMPATLDLLVTVLNNKTPVVGAEVEALADNRHLTMAVTDRNGVAKLTVDKNAKLQWIFAKKDNLGMDYISWKDIEPTDKLGSVEKYKTVLAQDYPEKIELNIEPSRKIAISAVDKNSHSLEGIRFVPWIVDLPFKRNYINLSGSKIAGQLTDKKGVALFNWLPLKAKLRPGTTFLVQQKDYYWQDPSTLFYRGTDNLNVNATLTPRAEIKGQIFYPDKKPAANIKVVAETFNDGRNGARAETVSDENGRFSLWANTEAQVSLTVNNEQWAVPLVSFYHKANTAKTVELSLVNGKLITGAIRQRRGPEVKPVANAQVILSAINEKITTDKTTTDKTTTDKTIPEFWLKKGYERLAVTRSVLTDENGIYNFVAAPGEYLLNIPGVRYELSVHKPLTIKVDATNDTPFEVETRIIERNIVPWNEYGLVKANQETLFDHRLTPAPIFSNASKVESCHQCHRASGDVDLIK